MVVLSIFSVKKSRNNSRIFMFVCTTVLYEYMNLLRNDIYNLFVNTHVWIKIYQEFYHGIIYRANEGRHVSIKVFILKLTNHSQVDIF